MSSSLFKSKKASLNDTFKYIPKNATKESKSSQKSFKAN